MQCKVHFEILEFLVVTYDMCFEQCTYDIFECPQHANELTKKRTYAVSGEK